jgi:hypothetical protein
MYLVAIAWLYIALMMSVAEATHSDGSLLGAIVTFFLYGVGPLALVLYLMAAPARRRAIREREAAAHLHPHPPGGMANGAARSGQPDGSSHAASTTERDLIAPVRKEP